MISAGKATLHELDTIYSVEDVYDMIEVLRIDAHNRRILAEQRQQREG